VLPALRQAGVTSGDLDAILVDNPSRVLATPTAAAGDGRTVDEG
jgi:predicted metal-dependent phosphotriesterase family hydrolase